MTQTFNVPERVTTALVAIDGALEVLDNRGDPKDYKKRFLAMEGAVAALRACLSEHGFTDQAQGVARLQTDLARVERGFIRAAEGAWREALVHRHYPHLSKTLRHWTAGQLALLQRPADAPPWDEDTDWQSRVARCILERQECRLTTDLRRALDRGRRRISRMAKRSAAAVPKRYRDEAAIKIFRDDPAIPATRLADAVGVARTALYDPEAFPLTAAALAMRSRERKGDADRRAARLRPKRRRTNRGRG